MLLVERTPIEAPSQMASRKALPDPAGPAANLASANYEVFSPCAAAAMYRRSCIESLSGFDEDYFCYVEDVDLAFRLCLRGYRCLQVPDSIAHHVGSGATGGRASDFAIHHGHRNMVGAVVKNMPGALLWLLVPLHVALNLATLVFVITKGQDVVIWRVKRDALRGLPALLKKRRVVQKKRHATTAEIWRLLNKTLLPMRARRSRALDALENVATIKPRFPARVWRYTPNW